MTQKLACGSTGHILAAGNPIQSFFFKICCIRDFCNLGNDNIVLYRFYSGLVITIILRNFSRFGVDIRFVHVVYQESLFVYTCTTTITPCFGTGPSHILIYIMILLFITNYTFS